MEFTGSGVPGFRVLGRLRANGRVQDSLVLDTQSKLAMRAQTLGWVTLGRGGAAGASLVGLLDEGQLDSL